MGESAFNRRHFLKMTAVTSLMPLFPAGALAQSSSATALHGLSAFGDLKYAKDFEHFDCVNPQAPKGGRFTFSPSSWMLNQNPNNFNSFNSYILRGDAPPRMNLCFDLVGIALRFFPTPTAQSLGNMFSAQSASTNGSYNLPGVEDPLLDEMIEKVGQVTNRQSLIAHMRVLDRYLRLRRDWIPNWYQPYHLAAYWDRFDFKEPKPDYGFPVETLWWKKDEQS